MHTKAVELRGTSVTLPAWNKLNQIEWSVEYKLFFIIIYFHSALEIWSGWLNDYKNVCCITISFGSFWFYLSAQGRLFTCLSNARQNLILNSLLWTESLLVRTSKQNTTNPTLYVFWASDEPTVTSTFLSPTSLTSSLRVSLKVLDTVYRKA